MTARAAVFLDRDGTINKDVHYLSRPEHLELIPGVPEALARLQAAGLPLVVVTNQSGIGRGMFTEAIFAEITARLDAMLQAHGITILATYHCPTDRMCRVRSRAASPATSCTCVRRSSTIST